MKKYTLPKSERLYLRESISELFAKGTAFTIFPYRVVYLISDQNAADAVDTLQSVYERQAQCAMMAVAPKKRFKHAVDRNHVKRLTREAYRLQKLPLWNRLLLRHKRLEVAFVYSDTKFISFLETQQLMQRIISRLLKAIDHA